METGSQGLEGVAERDVARRVPGAEFEQRGLEGRQRGRCLLHRLRHPGQAPQRFGLGAGLEQGQPAPKDLETF